MGCYMGSMSGVHSQLQKTAALRYEDTVRLFNKLGMKYAIVVALVYTL